MSGACGKVVHYLYTVPNYGTWIIVLIITIMVMTAD